MQVQIQCMHLFQPAALIHTCIHFLVNGQAWKTMPAMQRCVPNSHALLTVLIGRLQTSEQYSSRCDLIW